MMSKLKKNIFPIGSLSFHSIFNYCKYLAYKKANHAGGTQTWGSWVKACLLSLDELKKKCRPFVWDK